MNVDVNWWAVILATASSMVVGSVWYAKGVFGKTWMKLTKLDEKKMKEMSSAGPLAATVVASLVTAYVLAHVSFLAHKYFNNSFFVDAVSTAFWVWLGFTAARLVVHDAFEGRPVKLTALNAAHELVTLVVMGAIIGWLGV
jgi:hypothetical protein